MFCKGTRRRNAADRAQEEVAYDGSETGEERPLDYGRPRWHRPPLRMELDGGKAGDDKSGDRHPRSQLGPSETGKEADANPESHLLAARNPQIWARSQAAAQDLRLDKKI